MIENINEELEKILFEANVTKAINTMLQCLLSEDETNCKKCKNCKNVDACYYLMESKNFLPIFFILLLLTCR
jgi:hypothetical protein